MKRIFKSGEFYGVILTPGELRLIRGLLGRTGLEQFNRAARKRFMGLYGAFNKDHYPQKLGNPTIEIEDEELLGILEVEAKTPLPDEDITP